MVGDSGRSGRVERAMWIAQDLGLRVVANDAKDKMNAALYCRHGIVNLRNAYDTRDEVASAIAHSRSGCVLFVSSPDHLPRVVRDAMAQGATHALFASSDVPFSVLGPRNVEVLEPLHRKR